MHRVYRNVNDAFVDLVSGIHFGHIRTARTSSRYGDVMVIEQPVIIEYTKPTERVLFNPERDCNPFFHVYEALWMLAGRNDVASLDVYNSRMREFSDDGVTFNGAYGHRWRHAYGGYRWNKGGSGMDDGLQTVDQIKIIIDHLKAKPDSRRAVLNMWNVEDDLLKIGTTCKNCKGTGIYRGNYTPDDPTSTYVEETCEDCDGSGGLDQSKDVCCNLEVLFLIREETGIKLRNDWQGEGHSLTSEGTTPIRYLDMTVINRSNDLVWGALGANVVHFSFLQEYMAYAVGCEVGRYYQISNNLHAYTATWEPEKWFRGRQPLDIDPYRSSHFNTIPLMSNETGATREYWMMGFNNECNEFVDRYGRPGVVEKYGYDSEFLDKVAEPMLQAFKYYKAGSERDATAWLDKIKADDWRMAATNWIYKRLYKRATNA